MFKKVTKLLGAIALAGWMGVANASLIFDFSWESSNGKISGEILGLVDNASLQAASGVIITIVDGDADYIDFLAPFYNVSNNLFSVSGGVMVTSEFYAFAPNPVSFFRFNRFSGTAEYYLFNDTITPPSYYDSFTGSGIKFVNRVTVPEPGSVILVLLGLAGLSFTRYRKQY
ncbi:PEP-CTERM sorting domain-containing protein [Paraglaciecola sp. MB-3u-78]|uniref:PEP-CTERM sorting domain-containing protein n=1 Tax=Paraglaciecola sp. MB-3u-78 TaxID=2058332 RepID=UPI000C332439|nr:PEP-CTERM sorting domain-containing protein [Paraglaciecola sp. MB-3u-78]PKG99503.1 hypothetical protein CXF95_09750 [Paraglaciecola sp. MB-3u-78]